jgi:DNA repair exonuclease SbcCD nuclease subunit
MKYIYLSDTHIGGTDAQGYVKQPRYLSKYQEIMQGLQKYIQGRGDIDFIIHGGDMVDSTSPKSIQMATDFFDRLQCPTYLALGNHDLTPRDSIKLWLSHAPQFFPSGTIDYRIIKEGVRFDILACNWDGVIGFWDANGQQKPWLTPAQLAQLEDDDEDGIHTQVVVVHSPLYGVPPEQHGGIETLHGPEGDFCVKTLPSLKDSSLVLSGHTHMNMAQEKGGCHYVTTSAFSEMPFDFKVIEITKKGMLMRTISLSSLLPFKGEYDFNACYVQGRLTDRSFVQIWRR